jgi:molybdopterin/thiamine biosynthesis adenylyltransferase
MSGTWTKEQYLAELALRNKGLIADDDQQRLREATILVAGCGSTGGAVVEPLLRAGVLRFVLAEPGAYELNNLNRQRASLDAIGINKADWQARKVMEINPHAQVEIHEQGITPENAADLCRRASLIVDGVDVTSVSGLEAKYALHEAAAAARRVTVSAYDLAYRQFVRVYDYRRGHAPFDGKLPALRRAKTPMEALQLLVPVRAIPMDMVEEIERLLENPGESISQLGCTADLFGALSVPLVIELLAERPVRREMILDLKEAVLPVAIVRRRHILTFWRLFRLVQRSRSAK